VRDGDTHTQNNYFTEMCSGSEAGSYFRLIEVCIIDSWPESEMCSGSEAGSYSRLIDVCIIDSWPESEMCSGSATGSCLRLIDVCIIQEALIEEYGMAKQVWKYRSVTPHHPSPFS